MTDPTPPTVRCMYCDAPATTTVPWLAFGSTITLTLPVCATHKENPTQ